jgi:ADP-ribose pyrophosphatase YjhB (NUDIX family)
MSEHPYCSVCGHKLEMKICENDGKERPCCPDCSFVQYHNPKPTVKAAIFKEGKLLMVRRAEEPHIGGWDLPGGYLEWDEHPEEGCVREVEEETSVIVKIDRLIEVYHRVWNPDNKDSSILNLLYLCEWIEGDPSVESPEIDGAVWADTQALPGWVAYGHYDEMMKKLSLSE